VKLKLDCDLKSTETVEFGVGLEGDGGQTFRLVPIDSDVQQALREMVDTTWAAMQRHDEGPHKYDPSEKHSSTEYVYLPLNDGLAKTMKELHEANNLPLDAQALSDDERLFCYFARMTDKQGRRLTALRRATQFKGILNRRLIRLFTDALTIIRDKVFKLDADFDLLIDSSHVHILRPSGFEFAGKLQKAILAAVPDNVKAIQPDLKFVDLTVIQQYASEHPRAARYLASIRAQEETKDVAKGALKKLCKATGVEIEEKGGKIHVPAEHIMGFLEVLDRRRYEVPLVKGSPEMFKAGSRRKIGE